MSLDENLYRKGVVAIIRRNDGKVLFARIRDPHKPGWQLPQGGIEPGETPEAAVIREVQEETGVSGLRIVARANDWIEYQWPKSLQGALIGQMHIYFVLESANSEAISPQPTDDFDAYEWLAHEEILERCLHFKKSAYERAFHALGIA